MPRSIDLNSDMGESFGNWVMGNDAEVLRHVTTANVACGYHGGDPHIMDQTVRLAREHGVVVGAHPGLPDLMGFGRRRMAISREDARVYTLYQAGALRAFLASQGMRLHHIKPHGAFYLLCAENEEVARGFCDAVVQLDPSLTIYFPAPLWSVLPKVAGAYGLRVVGELYLDMDYTRDGLLRVSRRPAAADPQQVAERAVRFFTEGRIDTLDGAEIEFEAESICIHGDGPNAPAMLAALRAALTAAGFAIQAVPV